MAIRVQCSQCGTMHYLAGSDAFGPTMCECGQAIHVPADFGRGASGRELVREGTLGFRSRLRENTLVPMTSMADVAFLLIIFFLLTSTFAKDTGLDIKIPRAMAADQLPKREITIWVNRQGQIKLDDEWVRPIDLAPRLKDALSKTSLSAVTIRGDEQVPYGTIVTVMDAAKLLGADITLAAELQMEGPSVPSGMQEPQGQ